MTDCEIALEGGRVTAGVVKIGDTVRRPVGSDRSLQQALLVYLESRGFAATPRFLGVDDLGREILTFLPGDVPTDLRHFSDSQISAAAKLLRQFHDATTDFEEVRRRKAEVLCHNDWGPTNAVFHAEMPYGIIDFDTVAPGMRAWDLGYSAFTWLNFGNSEYTGDEQIRRLIVFSDAYGLKECSPAHIAVHAVARQTALATAARSDDKAELEMWSASAAAWTVTNVLERVSPTGYRI